MEFVLIAVGAGVADFFGGWVVALIVFAAAIIVRYVIAPAFEQIPVIGRVLAATIDAIITVETQRATDWIGYQITPLLAYVYSFPSGFHAWAGYVEAFAERVIARIEGMPDEISSKFNLPKKFDDLTKVVLTLVTAKFITDKLTADLATANSTIASNDTSAKKYADTVTTTAKVDTLKAANDYTDTKKKEIDNTIKDLQAKLTALNATVAANQVNAAGNLAAGLAGLTTTLTNQIINTGDQTKLYTDHQIGNVLTDLSTAALTLTGTVSIVRTLTTTLTTTLENCVFPTCEDYHTKNSPIGNSLNLLQDAELFALILSMLKDPEKVAGELGTIITGEGQAALNEVLSLIKK